ncbi:uncharacterized protein LOC119098975 [Pollicipes pollicipes]|uniref:uncharacterized protein LOC119098975 n=1 Tax=Pollicipes pollicipes TaxID=41117 RepID=UPI0018856F09|nr:uncharacterized protein LOC119098975 [Pollicipes pollicipes]
MAETTAPLPNYLCCVRPFEPRDALAVKTLVSDAALSTVWSFFTAALFRETFWELLIAAQAVLFVVFGVPGDLCLMTVPAFFAFVLAAIWAAHQIKVIASQSDVSNIPDTYQSLKRTNFWVAELYEPITGPAARFQLTFVSPQDVEKYQTDLKGLRRVVVGTCGVRKNRDDPQGAWLQRMSVAKSHRGHGIGTKMLDVACRFCGDAGLSNVRLQTTECNDAAKSMFYNRGFQILNYIHKPMFAGVRVGVYMFTKNVKPSRQSLEA